MRTCRLAKWLPLLLWACCAGCSSSHGNDSGTPNGDASVDPCAPDAERLLVLPDNDGDGFGVLTGAEPMGCVRPGFVAMRADQRRDCDDDDAAAHPDAPQYCDFDSDGHPGIQDCDDHNRRRYPSKPERCNGYDDDCDGLVDDADQDGQYHEDANWGLDQDEDGYPSALLFSCTDPGGGYIRWSLVTDDHLDCAPLDPDIHPLQGDDCATSTDANCDGVFTPVYAINEDSQVVRDDIAAAIMSAGPEDDPADVVVNEISLTIDICPGTYRVHLELLGDEEFGFSNSFTIRGHGASPADVILDAAATGRNVTVLPTYRWEASRVASRARLENLTLTRGRAPMRWPGGCVWQQGSPTYGGPFDGSLDLDRVIFRDCEARDGGAVAVDPTSALVMTDVVFEDTRAIVRGGGVYFLGTSLTMTRGSFENTQAPTGAGAAISAILTDNGRLTLQSVDLSTVNNDVEVVSSAYRVLHDLGSDADLMCTVPTCAP